MTILITRKPQCLYVRLFLTVGVDHHYSDGNKRQR